MAARRLSVLASVVTHLLLLAMGTTLRAQPSPVSVTPALSSDTVPTNGALDSMAFTVKNLSSRWTDKYWLSFSCTTITCPTGSNPNPAGPFTLGPRASATAYVKFYHPSSQISGTVSLTAADSNDVNDNTGTATIVPAAPGPFPVVDLSPYNADNQDMSRCAAACFAAAYGQSTVPYFSLDTPRNLTLVYRGDRVAPQPFVQVNVTHGGNSGNLPNAFYLEVKKANGSLITFLNGESKLRFTAPSMSTYRLAGQFDATANGMGSTGVYPVTIIVGAEYSGGSAEKSNATAVTVVNEAGSPIARGWTVAGVQRLYVQSDGSVLITDGTGTGVHFTGGPNTFTGPTGEFSRVTYNGTNYIRAYPDSSKVTFLRNGYLKSVSDRWGTTTVYHFNGNQLYNVGDPTDTTKVIQLQYGAYGVASITDPGNRTTSVNVDASGRLTSIKDPDNDSTSFGYDGSLRLSAITDRAGHATTLGYDSQAGTLASVAAPSIQVVNSDGSLTNAPPTSQYAAWQKVGVPYSATSGTPFSSVLASQVQGSVTDPGGHTSTFTVNNLGQPLVSTDALGGVTTATYTAGLPFTVTQPTGGSDTTIYNSNGTLQYSHPAGGARTWFHYSSWAGVPDSAYGDLPTTRQTVTSPGKVDSIRVGGVQFRGFTYTSDGRLDKELSAGDTVVARHHYTGVNLNHSVDSLPGPRRAYFYQDAFGRDTAVVALGIKTRITHYDVLNRAVAAYDSAGATPTTSYYGPMTLDSVKDAKGQVYRFAYNALGWLTQRTDAADSSDTSKYDRDGELRFWTNRRHQQVQYAYDALHRELSKSGTNTTTAGWSYSSNRLVVTAASPADTETIYLGVSGQPDSTRTGMAGQTFRRRYRYTAARFLDSVNVAGGGVTFMTRKYHYDGAGAVSTIALNADTTSLSRDANGAPTARTFPGGSQVTYQNNTPLSNLSQSYTASPYDTNVVLSLAYDVLGRVAFQFFGVQDQGTQYSYDAIGRLAAESSAYIPSPPSDCSGSPPPIVDPNGNSCIDGGWQTTGGTSYSYDAVGNRTDRGGTYGAGNRITYFDNCSYVTDADGDVTSRSCTGQGVTFYWSAESRLDSLTVNGLKVAFKYDAEGRLARKDSAGVSRYFLWDGDNLLAELGSGATSKIGEYSYYGTDQLHAMILGTTPYNAHQDALGNTLALTDASLERSYGFDAWGNQTSGADRLPFGGADRARWKGALWLGPEADVYYMRNRWYEPKTGRFLSEDPLGLDGGVNRYAFGAGDPVNGVDPFGLEWLIVNGAYMDCGTAGSIDGGNGNVEQWCWPVALSELNVSASAEDLPAGPDMPFTAGNTPLIGSAGGVGGSVSPQQQAACGLQVFNAAATVLGDLAFFTGVGAGLRALRASEFAASWGLRYFVEGKLQASAAAAVAAGARSRLASTALLSAADGYATGTISGFGTAMLSDWHWTDLIPGVASYNAIKAARAACSGN